MLLDQLRVLIVDEAGATRQRVAAMVRQAGVRAIHETDREDEALSTVTAHCPDLVFIGHCPDCAGGIALVRRLRASPQGRVPIILVTRHEDLWRLSEAREAGADEFLVVPFSLHSLVQRIHKAICRDPRSGGHGRIRLAG